MRRIVLISTAMILLGATSLWPLVFPLAVWIAGDLRRLKMRYLPAVLTIIAPVTISAIWSPVPLFAISWAGIVGMIWLLSSRLQYNLAIIVGFGLSVTIWAILEVNGGLHRATGINSNASLLGLFGLAIWPVGLPLIFLSLSRTAFVCSLAMLAGHFQVWKAGNRLEGIAIGGLIIIIFIGYGIIQTPDRFIPSGIEKDIALRQKTITGNSIETASPLCNNNSLLEWHWNGYGFGGYCYATGKPLIHNIFLLSWYELGILSVLFWAGIIWLVYLLKINVGIIGIVIVVGFSTPEFFARIEGLFILVNLYMMSNMITTAMSKRRKYASGKKTRNSPQYQRGRSLETISAWFRQ